MESLNGAVCHLLCLPQGAALHRLSAKDTQKEELSSGKGGGEGGRISLKVLTEPSYRAKTTLRVFVQEGVYQRAQASVCLIHKRLRALQGPPVGRW